MLYELREKKGLTQVALANKAGITQPYLAQIESGERKNPSLVTLKKLAKALKVTLAELVE